MRHGGSKASSASLLPYLEADGAGPNGCAEMMMVICCRFTIDSAWFGITITWISVALLRSLVWPRRTSDVDFMGLYRGIRHCRYRIELASPYASASSLQRESRAWCPCSGNDFLIQWKQADIQRPLDGYWYLDGATSETNVYVPP